MGSPPHGRGKGHGQSLRRGLKRITPAWAGKSDSPPVCGWVWEDHPRVGGEKWATGPALKAGPGSPPHGRGKGADRGRGPRALGITPAWAGKRRRNQIHELYSQDHPRMGGEKILFLSSCIRLLGSPPHGRGKGHACHQAAVVVGITPARAGKSPSSWQQNEPRRDHPRVGGEKFQWAPITSRRLGSPPRWRGKTRHLSHGLLPCG